MLSRYPLPSRFCGHSENLLVLDDSFLPVSGGRPDEAKKFRSRPPLHPVHQHLVLPVLVTEGTRARLGSPAKGQGMLRSIKGYTKVLVGLAVIQISSRSARPQRCLGQWRSQHWPTRRVHGL